MERAPTAPSRSRLSGVNRCSMSTDHGQFLAARVVVWAGVPRGHAKIVSEVLSFTCRVGRAGRRPRPCGSRVRRAAAPTPPSESAVPVNPSPAPTTWSSMAPVSHSPWGTSFVEFGGVRVARYEVDVLTGPTPLGFHAGLRGHRGVEGRVRRLPLSSLVRHRQKPTPVPTHGTLCSPGVDHGPRQSRGKMSCGEAKRIHACATINTG